MQKLHVVGRHVLSKQKLYQLLNRIKKLGLLKRNGQLSKNSDKFMNEMATKEIKLQGEQYAWIKLE